jgi:hypothetical protein
MRVSFYCRSSHDPNSSIFSRLIASPFYTDDRFPVNSCSLFTSTEVEVQLVFTLVVSQVTLTIHSGVPFSDELVGMTVLKTGNPAIEDLMLRNRGAEIPQNTSCRWSPSL